jgi:hypothetical protein
MLYNTRSIERGVDRGYDFKTDCRSASREQDLQSSRRSWSRERSTADLSTEEPSSKEGLDAFNTDVMGFEVLC